MESSTENNFSYRKLFLYFTIGISVILIPFLILSFLDIGGNAIFITTIVILCVLAVTALVMIILDIIRLFRKRRTNLK